MEYNWNMAYICSQEFNATLFETLKFIPKIVMHLTFTQETLERDLSQSVLICHHSCPQGAHVHLFLFVFSIHILVSSLLKGGLLLSQQDYRGHSPSCIRIPCSLLPSWHKKFLPPQPPLIVFIFMTGLLL